MKAEQLDKALRNFDHLPNSAHVRLPVLMAVAGISGSTVWRRVKAGLLPEPKRWGAGSASWNVGEIRTALGLAHAETS